MIPARLRTLVLLVFILIAAIVVSYVLFSDLKKLDNYTFSKSITRNTSNTQEEQALSIAENINYTSIFNMTRLTGQGFGWQSNTSDYTDYVWAQQIDSEVLNYYNVRSQNLKGNASISYTYNATVHSWNQVSISKPENETSGNTIRISSINGTILFQSKLYSSYAYYNGSWYQIVDTNQLNFDLSKSYVVEMNLQYTEYYAPVAGFGSLVTQTVIMDNNYQPRLISIYNSNPIS